MRIAVVCPYDLGSPGGVQQVCRGLVKGLQAAGDEADLIGPGRGAGWRSVGSTIPLRGNRSRVPLALGPAVWRRVAREVDGYEVVHVHEPLLPLVGPAALQSGSRVVATFHADPSPWVRRIYRWGARPASRLLEGTLVTAVSRTAASALPDGWGAVRVVPNGVDVVSLRPDREKIPGRVLFLGRDDPRKGFGVLARAWPRVAETADGAHLVVAGFDRASGLPETTFLGRVDDHVKRSALIEAQIVVVPNLGAESFGIVLVEAMAAGAAVIASNLAAFRDVAGDAALFVPPGDSDALGVAVSNLLVDHERRDTLARLAQERAARYDWPAVVSAYRSLYAEALGSS